MKMKESHKNLHVNHLLRIDIQSNTYLSFVITINETKFPDFLRIFQKRTLTHPDDHKSSSSAHSIQIHLPARNAVSKVIMDV